VSSPAGHPASAAALRLDVLWGEPPVGPHGARWMGLTLTWIELVDAF